MSKQNITIEDVRQAMFGYRRDDKGEVVQGDLMWDPGSREAKELMERARLEMFGYCRDQAGKIVNTLEEACQQPSQHQARLNPVFWTYSTRLWTVACQACGTPVYQEPGDYSQEKLRDEAAAANALREHRQVCKR